MNMHQPSAHPSHEVVVPGKPRLGQPGSDFETIDGEWPVVGVDL